MTTNSSVSAAWHADPSGRHQLRWWDGVRWTDQVADNGVVGVEALPPPGTTGATAVAVDGPGPPAAPEVAESLLGRSQLRFRSGGGNFPPGWWQVLDEQHQPVGKVWRQGRTNVLCDVDGTAVIGAAAALRYGSGQLRSEAIGGGDRRIGDLKILDAAGGELSPITFIQVGTSMSMRCRVGEEKKALTIKMKRSPSGAVKSVELIDPSKRQVGSITELERDGNPFKQGTCWLHLERDPGLAEPARSLAIAAPLLLSSYVFHVDG